MRVDELEKEVEEKDREIKRNKTSYCAKIVEIEEQLDTKNTEVDTLKVSLGVSQKVVNLNPSKNCRKELCGGVCF